jgi:FtsH-binding integral membrane protein
MALYGSTTERSLAGVGQFFFMGLVGLVLASIVGMFWHNDALQFLIRVIGVIVFTGLTAGRAAPKTNGGHGARERMGSYAVVGALALYLNFINLFLMLLRVLSGRRD